MIEFYRTNLHFHFNEIHLREVFTSSSPFPMCLDNTDDTVSKRFRLKTYDGILQSCRINHGGRYGGKTESQGESFYRAANTSCLTVFDRLTAVTFVECARIPAIKLLSASRRNKHRPIAELSSKRDTGRAIESYLINIYWARPTGV